MPTEPSRTVTAAVEGLFGEPPIQRDLAFQLLNSWVTNLQTAEGLIDRQVLIVIAVFAGFLALDTGVLAKLTFQGAELQRTGIVLCAVPVTIAYSYYRYMTQVSFVQDLRTAISVLYKKLHESVYYGGLDLLAHAPSMRNLEMYDTLRAPRSMQSFHKRTTDVVSLSLMFGPIAALVYCIVRLWHYRDVGVSLRGVMVALSFIFIFRAWTFGVRLHAP